MKIISLYILHGLRAVPHSQLSPSRERKISARKINRRRAKTGSESRGASRSHERPISFRSRDGLSSERGTARSLHFTSQNNLHCRHESVFVGQLVNTPLRRPVFDLSFVYSYSLFISMTWRVVTSSAVRVLVSFSVN